MTRKKNASMSPELAALGDIEAVLDSIPGKTERSLIRKELTALLRTLERAIDAIDSLPDPRKIAAAKRKLESISRVLDHSEANPMISASQNGHARSFHRHPDTASFPKRSSPRYPNPMKAGYSMRPSLSAGSHMADADAGSSPLQPAGCRVRRSPQRVGIVSPFSIQLPGRLPKSGASVARRQEFWRHIRGAQPKTGFAAFGILESAA